MAVRLVPQETLTESVLHPQEAAADAMAARGRRRRALGAWRAFAACQREGRLRTLRACAVSFPSARPEPPAAAAAAAPAGESARAGPRRAGPRSPAPPPLDVPAIVSRALAERGAGAAPDLGGLTLGPKPDGGGGGGAPLFWKLLLLAAPGGAEGATARWLRAKLAGGGGGAAPPPPPPRAAAACM